MNRLALDETERSDLLSWFIVVSIALSFFLWGLLIYFAVGTKGPPPWGFGNIEDIPGESYYSSHKTKLYLGPDQPAGEAVAPQHVMEPPKSPERMQK